MSSRLGPFAALWVALAVAGNVQAFDGTWIPRKPEAHCDVKDYGAKGDGKTKDTQAIQSAIDMCALYGGQVDLQDGVYVSGMITLKGGIVFNIDASATLKGSQDDADYPDTNPPIQNSQLKECKKALVYAEKADDLVIVGGGTIDGSGSNPKWKGPEATRPIAVFINLSQRVTIQNLRVINSAMWSVVNMENDHVVMKGLRVNSPDGPTRDGIDIVDCHHVSVEDAEIFSEDDSICLKSGSAKGVYDVTVRDSRILQSSVANGIKLGTASTGSFKKIVFERIQMKNVKQAAMAVESVDGAVIDDIHFNHIQFTDTGAAIYMILGRRQGSPSPAGGIKNVFFKTITGQTNLPWGSAISGSVDSTGVHKIQEVDFDSVDVKNDEPIASTPRTPPEYSGQYPDPRLWQALPAYGYFLRHVSGISFNQSSTQAPMNDSRREIVQDDVTDFTKE